MIALACVALVVFCWGCWPANPASRAAVVLADDRPRSSAPHGWLLPLAGAGLVGLVLVVLAPRALVWLVPSVMAAMTFIWLVQQARASRIRQQASAEVVQSCQALAAQLRVGEIAAAALTRVATDSPLLRPVAATQAIGGDVPQALRAQATRPGCGGLAGLARSWQLCQLTGAPVADAASRVAEALRADAAAERMVAGELAAARASGRLLALLPALGVGLGYVSGGDPVQFLVVTPLGQLCLAVAVCLVCLGLIWTTRLAAVREIDEER